MGRKSLKPVDRLKSDHEREMLVELAEITEAITEQTEVLKRLDDNIKRWTKASKALTKSLNIMKSRMKNIQQLLIETPRAS